MAVVKVAGYYQVVHLAVQSRGFVLAAWHQAHKGLAMVRNRFAVVVGDALAAAMAPVKKYIGTTCNMILVPNMTSILTMLFISGNTSSLVAA